LLSGATEPVTLLARWLDRTLRGESLVDAEDSGFVRIEVRHPNGHVAALTNPIILT